MTKSISKITILVALGLLLVAPIVSYFYLNSGYNYRLETLKLLSDKGKVAPFNVVSDSTTFSDDDLRSKVTALAFMRGTDEEVSTIQRLSEQFGEREEFQVLVMTVENGFNEELRNVRVMSMTQNAAKQFFHTHLTDTIEFSTPSFALIDTAGHIRRLYSGEPVQPLSRKLVEHIATVLPRTRKSDIIHKDLIDEE